MADNTTPCRHCGMQPGSHGATVDGKLWCPVYATYEAQPPTPDAALREEIAALRIVGRQMSNVMFAVAQGHVLSKAEMTTGRQLQTQWDAIKRAESGGG